LLSIQAIRLSNKNRGIMGMKSSSDLKHRSNLSSIHLKGLELGSLSRRMKLLKELFGNSIPNIEPINSSLDLSSFVLI